MPVAAQNLYAVLFRRLERALRSSSGEPLFLEDQYFDQVNINWAANRWRDPKGVFRRAGGKSERLAPGRGGSRQKIDVPTTRKGSGIQPLFARQRESGHR